jgi:hypothetical protein
MPEWLASVSRELDLPEGLGPAVAEPVLALVRDVAHGIDRPSGPLTAYLVGVLAGARAASGGGVDTFGSAAPPSDDAVWFSELIGVGGPVDLGDPDGETVIQETVEAAELIRALVAGHRPAD